MKKKILTLLVLLMTAVTGAVAQGSDPDPIELTSADGETWTLASMPDYDVELEVEYETALALSETTDNSAALTEWNGYEADVTLTRTLAAGSWNTFAVPFATAIPDGWTVKKLTTSSYNSSTKELELTFDGATSIVAGTPYLVKVDANVENPTFNDVTVSKTPAPVSSDVVNFIPTLGKELVTGPDGHKSEADYVLFLTSGNKLKNPTVVNDSEQQSSYMKGFRAYFQLKGEAASARAFNLNLDDGTTSIISIAAEDGGQSANGIYTIDGRKLESMPTKKGVYIVNGKKVVIK